MPQVKSNQSLTLVVPCYNEEKRLDPNEFHRLAQADGVRLLFVNDGSTDETEGLLRALCAPLGDRARLLSLAQNSGKAEAVRQGLLAALQDGAPLVGYLDADLSTPVDEALRLLGVLRARPEVEVLLASRVRLLGNRVERQPMRHYLGRIFATAASLVLDIMIYDTQCGAKLFRATPALRDALAEPFGSRWVFDVELLGRLAVGTQQQPPLPASAFAEVPLLQWRDVAGSKLKPHHMLRAAAELAQIRGRLARRQVK